MLLQITNSRNILFPAFLFFTAIAGAQDYCTITPGSTCTDDAITSVSFDDIYHSSDCGDGYQDFTSVIFEANANETYLFTVDVPVGTAAGVWIDFDHNGQFGADEFTDLGVLEAEGVLWDLISVPASAVNGKTRMRVKSQFDIPVGANSACFRPALLLGEIEDYSININGGTMEAPEFDPDIITLFPNPVNNILNINSTGTIPESIEIYTLSGQLITYQSFTVTSEGYSINVQHLTSGIYIVRLITKNNTVTKRILKS